ncbi:D-2-hydroxyacid dehydrogenase [Megasphaera sp. ASD88]|uniref:D-2-hydroxyacid dehydrogenase n=1 Tax=Megasphaera sp. ASD88 TaxID=2027407 RepID=UPI000BAB371D|nr:D-2-hydroxyacid dehydrogenase [Megasphaera sp. ASD88]PAV39150.1 D-2-hydroxyacid dehydrogenase [Megasphaera sp. ASD88]
MRILVAMEVHEEHVRWIEEAAQGHEVVYWPVKGLVSASVSEEELAKAVVIIGNVVPAQLRHARRLRWLQLSSAGADAYCKDGVMPAGAALTNATGAFGLAIAEHMTALVFAMMKKLYRYYDNQKNADWHDEGQVESVYGKTVLVIGFGDLGRQFGKRMKAMGAHVVGMRRRSGDVPTEADEMGTMDKLDEYLAKADIVASCLPNTAETYHLYTKERFDAMKKGAYFINVGRGSNVVQDDLCAAVRSGHLAGAAVDVTEPEPLPADSPMWHTPGLYVTPHVSGGYHLQATHDNIVRIAAANLRHFLAGEALENVVDFATGYKK